MTFLDGMARLARILEGLLRVNIFPTKMQPREERLDFTLLDYLEC